MEPWSQPPAPPLRHRLPRRTIVLICALLVLSAAAVAVYLAASGSDGEQEDIRRTVVDFAHAVDRDDTATVLTMLCAQEAEGVVDDVASPGDRGDPRAEVVPITVSGIRVTGDVAEVRVTRPQQSPVTLFLRKEDGSWKLCDPERYGR